MRVVVTGASGFIGRYVFRRLRAGGHDVVGLGRAADGNQAALPLERGPRPPTGAPLTELLQGADALVHLAARSQAGQDDPLSDYYASNVAFTEELLQSAAAVHLRRVVLTSTRLIYPPDVGGPVEETTPAAPATAYGLSKLVAEQLLAFYARRAGFEGTALRVAQVFGPGDGGRGILPRFILAAQQGRDLVIHGEGAAVRDWVFVEDVAAAVELTLERDPPSSLINIGGGGHSIRELAEAVTSEVPDTFVRHERTEAEDLSVYRLRCDRAERELGWTSRPLREGIRRTIDTLSREDA
jgi:nucleoside-diphosphate-sugar epimerase